MCRVKIFLLTSINVPQLAFYMHYSPPNRRWSTPPSVYNYPAVPLHRSKADH